VLLALLAFLPFLSFLLLLAFLLLLDFLLLMAFLLLLDSLPVLNAKTHVLSRLLLPRSVPVEQEYEEQNQFFALYWAIRQ
jgi:hypothetical protein